MFVIIDCIHFQRDGLKFLTLIDIQSIAKHPKIRSTTYQRKRHVENNAITSTSVTLIVTYIAH